jgi:hypothetical protein
MLGREAIALPVATGGKPVVKRLLRPVDEGLPAALECALIAVRRGRLRSPSARSCGHRQRPTRPLEARLCVETLIV